MDREHTGGEVQRLGGVGTMQASRDELVATRGAGVSRLRSRERNGELDAWRRDRALPERALPELIGQAA